MYEFQVVPLGAACDSGVAIEFQGYGGHTDPGKHALEVTVAFRKPVQGLDRAPAHQPEVAGIDRNRRIADPIDQTIEKAGRDAFKPAFAGPGSAFHQHDIGPFAPFGKHVGNQFGGILKVCIHKHHGLAAGVLQAGRDCRLLAEVSGQLQDTDFWLPLPGGHQNGDRIIPTAVVDKQQLKTAVELLPGRPESSQQGREHFSLVVDRNNYAQHRFRGA